jgi:hypothetical protein
VAEICSGGHVTDRAVAGFRSCIGFSPMLYYGYWSILNFQRYSTKLLLGEDMLPNFKDSEHKKFYLPSSFAQKRGGTQNAK